MSPCSSPNLFARTSPTCARDERLERASAVVEPDARQTWHAPVSENWDMDFARRFCFSASTFTSCSWDRPSVEPSARGDLRPSWLGGNGRFDSFVPMPANVPRRDEEPRFGPSKLVRFGSEGRMGDVMAAMPTLALSTPPF